MSQDIDHKLAGYAALIADYDLEVIPHWHTSIVVPSSAHKTDSSKNIVVESFPAKYWPGDTLGDHLEFALKYDGINLGILAQLFRKIDSQDLINYLQSKPTGAYARRLWFLYEFITGLTLPLDNLTQGNYILKVEGSYSSGSIKIHK